MGFRALQLSKTEDGKQKNEILTLEEKDLMEGEVLVEVACSSLNYKDGLALTGAAPVVRRWPMIPGIDLAGRVAESSHADFSAGDEIIVNGFGLGETHYGGYAEKARLKAAWLTPMPKGMTVEQAMMIGTAGYTAMLCLLALEAQGVSPDKGTVAVSGAAGGVGSVALMLLAAKGYKIAAITGRAEEEAYLKKLGATEILARSDFTDKAPPMGKARFAGAIDVAGGEVLANLLGQIDYGGAAAACGLANNMALPASVAPFILRGITLCGIDSVMAAQALRRKAYQRLAQDLDFALLEEQVSKRVKLDEVSSYGQKILGGQVRGRVLVMLQG